MGSGTIREREGNGGGGRGRGGGGIGRGAASRHIASLRTAPHCIAPPLPLRSTHSFRTPPPSSFAVRLASPTSADTTPITHTRTHTRHAAPSTAPHPIAFTSVHQLRLLRPIRHAVGAVRDEGGGRASATDAATAAASRSRSGRAPWAGGCWSGRDVQRARATRWEQAPRQPATAGAGADRARSGVMAPLLRPLAHRLAALRVLATFSSVGLPMCVWMYVWISGSQKDQNLTHHIAKEQTGEAKGKGMGKARVHHLLPACRTAPRCDSCHGVADKGQFRSVSRPACVCVR